MLDYEALIIANSSWLSFLKRMDESLSLKFRICGAIALLLLLCKWLGFIEIEMKGLAMCVLLALVVVIVLPGILIRPGVTNSIKKMMDALPYFVDLTAVCIQAGMTVESAVKFVAERSDDLDKNLASLMRYLTKRAEVSGLEDALTEIYHSINITEMRMFCGTLQQSVHYGTSLYDNLMELSKDIRELQLLDSEEKIGKLSAKMSVPLILFVMFPITVLIAAPGILRIIKNGLF
nr:type II secretion system F family protein [Mixta theicola]